MSSSRYVSADPTPRWSTEYDGHPLLFTVIHPINRFRDDFPSSLLPEMQRGRNADVLQSTEFEEILGYVLGSVIGSGAEATVYEGYRDGVFPYALKKYSQVANLDGSVPREVDIAQSLSHPRCTSVVDHFVTPAGSHIVVMPLARAGSLLSSDVPELTVSGAVTLLRDTGSAIAHMHSRNIVHRDIKPMNILLFDDGYAICDYSVSVRLNEGEEVLSGIVGTSVFMAPEVSVNPYAAKPVDMWAIGITVYALLFGRYPWTLDHLLTGDGQKELNQAAREVEGDLTFPDTPVVPIEMKTILAGLLDKDATRRMKADDLAEHQWLARQAQEWSEILSAALDES